MRFRASCLFVWSAGLLLTSAVYAEPRPEWDHIERLQPTNQQVEAVFSLFLSELPSLLSNPQDRDLVSELAPRALRLLTPEQRDALAEMAPGQQVERIGSMTETERTRFLFDTARSLVHPSKQEWLRRVEELAEPESR